MGFILSFPNYLSHEMTAYVKKNCHKNDYFQKLWPIKGFFSPSNLLADYSSHILQ